MLEKNLGYRTIYRKQVVNSETLFKINLPNLPLLGNLSQNEFKNQLQITLNDEKSAIEFYTKLWEQAPNELHKEFIGEALSEEKKHLELFKNLYTLHFNEEPNIEIKTVTYNNYKDGLLHALKDELEAADYYKKMALSNSNDTIKQSYFYAMQDELEHSIMFSTLLNSL